MARIKIFGEPIEMKIEGDSIGEAILKQLGMSSSSTIILRNGKPIPEDAPISEDDEITVIRSFSGG